MTFRYRAIAPLTLLSVSFFATAYPVSAHHHNGDSDAMVAIRRLYQSFNAAEKRGDWGSIRSWYANNLSDDYVSKAVNGRLLATKKQILAQLPIQPSRGPTVAAGFTITDLRQTGRDQIVVIIQETGKTTVVDRGGRFGIKGASHLLSSLMISRDTWKKHANKWLEVERAILKSDTLMDGKEILRRLPGSSTSAKAQMP
jgi:hypothetical protein